MFIDQFTIPYQQTPTPTTDSPTLSASMDNWPMILTFLPTSAYQILCNSCRMLAGFWETVDRSCGAMADDPLLTPLTKQQEKYNASHIKSKKCLERSFGVLKSRFMQVLTTVKTKNTYKNQYDVKKSNWTCTDNNPKVNGTHGKVLSQGILMWNNTNCK